MYWKRTKGWTKHWDFILLDMLVLQIAFIIAYMLRHGVGNPYETFLYRSMAFSLCVADLLITILYESLKNVLKRGYYQELSMTLKHVVLVSLASSFYLFVVQLGGQYSRSVFALTAVFYFGMTYIVRLLWKKHLKKKLRQACKRSLLIVTTEELAEKVIKQFYAWDLVGYTIAGVVLSDKDATGSNIADVPVVVAMSNLANYVCREWVDEVFISLPRGEFLQEELMRDLTSTGITVHTALMNRGQGLASQNVVERIAGYTVLTSSISYATTRQLFMKRCIDIIGGLMGCIITCLLTLIVGPMIKIQSPGPVFFSQERIGRNGKKFRIYKFRSMYPDAEARKQELMEKNKMSDDKMFKMDFDPRVIGNKILEDGTRKMGIGHFLRATSLDEFPQFLNVLKGDMSLVGTRPPTVDEWEKYELHHRARMAIKPGITGMWQVSGRSNITDFEEVVKLDTRYITEWSMGLDVRILVKTVGAVLKKDGSV